MGDTTIKELLARLQGDDPEGWYRAGGEATRLAASKTAVAALCDLLRHGKHEMQRWEAAYILGSAWKAPLAADALQETVHNPFETPLVRGICAEQLTHFETSIGRRKLTATYVEGLDAPSPIVRFWCIYGLAALKAGSARAKLQELAATDHAECPGWSKVSTEAKWALAILDDLALPDRLWPGPFQKPEPLPNPTRSAFLKRAVELQGAVIVRGKELIAEGLDRCEPDRDPTAGAEVIAIREACRVLQTFDLSGCEIYCSTEPDMMCLGAIYWARLARIYYAAPRTGAAEIALPTRNLSRRQGRAPFAAWKAFAGKIRY
jgi:tRNA(Arg) A34 adenosine deaminase TadA